MSYEEYRYVRVPDPFDARVMLLVAAVIIALLILTGVL